METLHELDRIRARHPAPPAAGSEAETQAMARFASFFSSFAPDRVQTLLAETYAEDIYFNDTLMTSVELSARRPESEWRPTAPLASYRCPASRRIIPSTMSRSWSERR